jgi:hypothetical protein
MFLAVYESQEVYFPESGETITVTRTPIDYRVTGENDEGVYKGCGSTPLEAIADYRAVISDES